MSADLDRILKWASIGSQVLEGILKMTSALAQKDQGKLHPLDAYAEISAIDRHLEAALKAESEAFSGTAAP